MGNAGDKVVAPGPRSRNRRRPCRSAARMWQPEKAAACSWRVICTVIREVRSDSRKERFLFAGKAEDVSHASSSSCLLKDRMFSSACLYVFFIPSRQYS